MTIAMRNTSNGTVNQLPSTPSGMAIVYRRDLRLASRRPVDMLLPVGFFIVAASLFPLGVGPEPATLRQIAAGVVWVGALLAALMSVTHLYTADAADGSLEQMWLAANPPWTWVIARVASHWTLTGVPLIAAAPLIGLWFGLEADALLTLLAALALGTPVLSLLGGFGAALTLGTRNPGVLLILLVVPLCVPLLIFGAGAVTAVQGGQSGAAQLSLLGALLIVAAMALPPATVAALRIAIE